MTELAETPSSPLDRVRPGTKAAYAVGNVGIQAVVALVSFFLLFFYTDAVLISAGLASTALLVAKIWDIVNDPLFGWMSDRTRSRRFGRRRVYLVYGAVPLALATVLLFSIPVGLTGVTAFLTIVVTFIIFDTTLTLVSVPYTAMSAELTHDYDGRTSLLAVSSVGAVIGFLAGGAIAPGIFDGADDLASGFRVVGAIFGVLAGLCVAFVAWRVRPPTEPAGDQSVPIIPAIKQTFTNRPFVRLIIAFGLVRFGFTAVSTALTFFVVHRLGEEESAVASILGVLLVTVAIFIPLWKRVADRSSKGTAYAAGLVITAVGLLATYALGEGQRGAMLIVAFVIGIGISAHWVIPWAMLPDVVEYDQLETGERREGMYFGVYGLIDKIARTLGLVVVGWVLAGFGYVPDAAQGSSAVFGIRLMTGPVPALFVLAAVPILLKYPVDRQSHAEVRRELST